MPSAKKFLASGLLAISLLSVAHGSAKFKAAVSYAVGTKPSAAAMATSTATASPTSLSLTPAMLQLGTMAGSAFCWATETAP